MKHTKREWMPLYSFLDRKRVTDHLADMAARGWMLDRLGTWSWHYRRTEPKQLRFAVTFFAGAGRFSPAPAAGLDTFQDYCAQAGWHRAASSDQVQVFYSEDPAAVPIDTDPAAELENIRRSIGKPMIRNYLALLLLCLLEVAFQCYQIWTDPVDTLASPTALLAATAYLPLLVLTLKVATVSLASITVFSGLDPDRLSNGLMWYGCPERLSFSISYAYRMLPMLMEEFQNVLLSYRLRGNPPAHETLGGKIKYLIYQVKIIMQSFYPLMLNTAKRSRTTVEALELRGYRYAAVNKSVKKIKLAALKVTYNDGLFLAVSFLVVAVAVLISTLL